MKTYRISLCALACLGATALPCIAQDANKLNGSWKMDRSSLKYDGPTYSITTDANGYMVTRDGNPTPKIVCIGKPNAPDNFPGSTGRFCRTCRRMARR